MTSHPSVSILSCLAFLSGVLALGCGAATRHRVLTFFFDGVPPLNQGGGKKEGKKGGPGGSARRGPVSKASLHAPYKEKKCNLCHKGLPMRRKNSRSGISALSGTPGLVLPLAELCLKCHELPGTKYVHGPVAMGRCETCHMPHRSPFPHLVKKEKVRDLCFQCHTKDLFVTMDLHDEKGWIRRECTSCHDPHGGSRPDLVHPPARGGKRKPGGPAVPGLKPSLRKAREGAASRPAGKSPAGPSPRKKPSPSKERTGRG